MPDVQIEGRDLFFEFDDAGVVVDADRTELAEGCPVAQLRRTAPASCG
ncbi:MAG TPA: hypothetical protein VEV41_02865 [Terriglobales bacterium]|nr:hypothetical protein [Terriglobales bacterium]